jgi:T-complex protein 1 subunit eta
MIVRRCFKTNTVVAGGGATEMELSRGLKKHAALIAGKEQLVMNMFAKAL